MYIRRRSANETMIRSAVRRGKESGNQFGKWIGRG